uniref:AC4 protein n=1 Tax=Sweet potato leaf curl virus TaxID=100755 RepID=J9YLC3_9GEMI|nr:AC4 protein [Sweet potato leaf curl virus]AFS44525.1 AC4 protein [Sweet potato leaf curl virus]
MGNLTSMCWCSSKANSSAQIADSSTLFPHQGRLTFTPTSRELNPRPMSSPTLTRTEIPSHGVNSRSTADLLEEVSRLLTTQPQRL